MQKRSFLSLLGQRYAAPTTGTGSPPSICIQVHRALCTYDQGWECVHDYVASTINAPMYF
jgi:hypothetical protein